MAFSDDFPTWLNLWVARLRAEELRQTALECQSEPADVRLGAIERKHLDMLSLKPPCCLMCGFIQVLSMLRMPPKRASASSTAP